MYNPGYNSDTYEYDIVLIKLQTAIDFQPNIQPLKLATLNNDGYAIQLHFAIQLQFRSKTSWNYIRVEKYYCNTLA